MWLCKACNKVNSIHPEITKLPFSNLKGLNPSPHPRGDFYKPLTYDWSKFSYVVLILVLWKNNIQHRLLPAWFDLIRHNKLLCKPQWLTAYWVWANLLGETKCSLDCLTIVKFCFLYLHINACLLCASKPLIWNDQNRCIRYILAEFSLHRVSGFLC